MHEITKIETEKKTKKIRVEIDGEYHLFLYARDFRKTAFKMIKLDAKISDQDLEALIDHVLTRGKRRVFHLLGKQDYAKEQLVRKLRKEGYLEDHIQQILMPFLEKGWVDDRKILKRRIEDYKAQKSRREILYNLTQKGFDKSQVQEILDEIYPDSSEYESAYHLLNKRFSLKRLKMDQDVLKVKSLSYLSRKGYSYDICRKAYQAFIENTENSQNS